MQQLAHKAIIKFLVSLHEKDVKEFRTDDGTNLEGAAEDLKMNTL